MLYLIIIFSFTIAAFAVITFLFYWIPKKAGYKELGVILSSIVGSCLTLLVLSFVFKDALFNKSDAKVLMKNIGIVLNDDFSIIDNHSSWDYGQTLSLKISNKDKYKIVTENKNSAHFIDNPNMRKFFSTLETNIHTSTVQSYEDEDGFVIERLKPNGTKVLSTYYRSILDTNTNILTIEVDH